jgi:hypothetical protein
VGVGGYCDVWVCVRARKGREREGHEVRSM